MDLKDPRRKVPKKNRSYAESFKYAFIGIKTVFQEERNMRTHVLLGIVTFLLSSFLHLSRAEWLWILLSIFLMMVMEIWNTVIENVVDLVTERTFHPLAKKAKDMAAAAVLFTAFFSIIIAVMILLPKAMQLFLSFKH